MVFCLKNNQLQLADTQKLRLLLHLYDKYKVFFHLLCNTLLYYE
jgi:hypothetical protein